MIELKHKEIFQAAPQLKVIAPGRINILGEHLDYNGGVVLPAAVNRSLEFTFSTSPSAEATLFIYASSLNEHATIDPKSKLTRGWMAYFANALVALKEESLSIDQDISICFDGNIPLGAGMSSSAALCCGLIQGLSDLHHWSLSPARIAKLAQRTEHLTGANCGLMDQYAVMFSKEGHILKLDNSDLATSLIPWNLSDTSFLLINSKVDHQLAGTDSDYNQRRAVCEKGLALLQQKFPEVQHLATATSIHLTYLMDHMIPDDIIKISYVLEETARVSEAEVAIQQGDAKALGHLMYQTHKGLSEKYQVAIPETDFLANLGPLIDGVYGARMVGAGFGGCVLFLVEKAKAKRIIEQVHRKYLDLFGIDSTGFEVEISDGVSSRLM